MIRTTVNQQPPNSDQEIIPTVLHARVVSDTGGGPEKTILNSPRRLKAHGYRAVCAYMHPPKDSGFNEIQRRADELDAPIVSFEDHGVLDARVLKWLLRVCRENQVAIYHGHDYKSDILGLMLRRYWPMRLVTTAHGWGKTTWKTSLYFSLDRWCLRAYDKVICVSEDLLRQCVAAGVPASRCSVIENAIDVEQYQLTLSRAEAKWRLGVPTAHVLIGAVGRLSKEKSFESLIQVVDRLIDSGLDVALVIVGEGDERDSLQSLIDRLGRTEQIRLLGYRADVADIYRAFDIFALSSVREGLPNVVLEAMVSEVPVVSEAVGGIPALIEDGQSGFLVDRDNGLSLEHCLARLAIDEDLRVRIGAASRKRVRDCYSFESRMKRICKVYDDVLRGPGQQEREIHFRFD